LCAVDVAGAVFEEISVRTNPLSSIIVLKKLRDDLTVEVIFFGNSDKSGDVVVNKEASASVNDIKAKL
jgi:hypothetical protein